MNTMQRDSIISFPFFNISVNPPSSFSLFGKTIYFYGVIIALAFLVCAVICAKRAKRFGLKEDDIYDVLIWLIPLSIIGARLYFVLFKLDYYSAHPKEIMAIWEGGLAIYGGVIAGIITAFIVCKVKKISFLAMCDDLLNGCILGQAIGRWGNFMNREAFGGETGIFCRMGLTDPAGSTIYVHPTFLYESLWNLIGFFILSRVSRKRRYNGQIMLLYFFWYGLGRAWIEGLRTDSLYWGSIRVSQALSLVLVAVSLILLVINRKKDTLNG